MKYFVEKLAISAKSVVKIAFQSRKHTAGGGKYNGRIIVMGNGPSLNSSIAEHYDALSASPLMAVNFAALAPVFFDLRPDFYVLADPHFFQESSGPDDNLSKLRLALSNVSWRFTLFVPTKYGKTAKKLYNNSKISIRTFNAIGAEGFDTISHFAYSHGLAMPRPRNVLIPAIMLAIGEGFDEIILTGADHSWLKTISVTDDNEVVSIQPHFYADEKHEEERIRHEYRGYRLHQIVESFAVAFKSYHDIARYAKKKNVKILNATPGSFIDAFQRISL